MKKFFLLILVLTLASLACSATELLSGGSTDGDSSQPTIFPTAAPTIPLVPPSSTETSSAVEDPAAEPTEIAPTETSPGEATPTVLGAPSTSDFYTCTSPCVFDGSNDQSIFPEKIKIINFTFNYENFPAGAAYTRVWARNGVEWARYQCSWYGPSSGVDQITLTEPAGLASGTWVVTITINGEIVLQESLEVDGGWTYWDPAGFFGSCYGKR